MNSSHVYSDKSAGFFRYRATDGTHSHIHIVHVGLATIDNTSDPGSPSSPDTLINPETDVNRTARNFFVYAQALTNVAYTLSLMDFQPVVGGVPSGPKLALLPYTVTGGMAGANTPEAETDFTFRDAEGAPMRFVFFGGGSDWNPTTKAALFPDWAGGAGSQFAAYITGTAKTSVVTKPANLTNVVSHNGKIAITALSLVSTLNNRLRRDYRVK